jgi:hypothetical protein
MGYWLQFGGWRVEEDVRIEEDVKIENVLGCSHDDDPARAAESGETRVITLAAAGNGETGVAIRDQGSNTRPG